MGGLHTNRKLSSHALLAILASFVLVGCVSLKVVSQGVTSYHNGRVKIYHAGSYRVGPLAKEWRTLNADVSAIAFYHPIYRATLFTDAFCGVHEEATPEELISRMIGRLDGKRLMEKRDVTLDGRGAAYRHFSGNVDGVPVLLRLVTVMKHGCSFDFVSVAPRATDALVGIDFESFYQGFSYK